MGMTYHMMSNIHMYSILVWIVYELFVLVIQNILFNELCICLDLLSRYLNSISQSLCCAPCWRESIDSLLKWYFSFTFVSITLILSLCSIPIEVLTLRANIISVVAPDIHAHGPKSRTVVITGLRLYFACQECWFLEFLRRYDSLSDLIAGLLLLRI
jgi:hypothetical protein